MHGRMNVTYAFPPDPCTPSRRSTARRPPSVRLLCDGRATQAVLEFMRTTGVGRIGAERAPPEEEEGEDSKGEKARLGPP